MEAGSWKLEIFAVKK